MSLDGDVAHICTTITFQEQLLIWRKQTPAEHFGSAPEWRDIRKEPARNVGTRITQGDSLAGSSAVLGYARRPVVLRPHFSMSMPFSVQCIYTITLVRSKDLVP